MRPLCRPWRRCSLRSSAEESGVKLASPCCQASAPRAGAMAAPPPHPGGWLKWSHVSSAPRAESGHHTTAHPCCHHSQQEALLPCPLIPGPQPHLAILTTPARDFPFTMSTNWTAISSPQRLWASLVLAPKWGQLMTFSWATKARSRGGSCPEKDSSWSAAVCCPGADGGEEGRRDTAFQVCFVKMAPGLNAWLLHECSTAAKGTEL